MIVLNVVAVVDVVVAVVLVLLRNVNNHNLLQAILEIKPLVELMVQIIMVEIK